MFLNTIEIKADSLVSSIVKENHRTADIFRKYGIEYCCGGNWPLSTVCLNNGLEFELVKKELENARRKIQLPPLINYNDWDTDFLINYLINIHHRYLRNSLPDTAEIIKNFSDGHKKQYPEMQQINDLFRQLQDEIIPHLTYEEDTIFPYILQITHAYENNDSYAALLVKTLRKPLHLIMKHEEEALTAIILKIRLLTNSYSIPDKCCVSHRLTLSRLHDLDNDLLQHIYLENEILFPRALKIESELLK